MVSEIKNENQNAQHLTRGIKHWGCGGYSNGISRIKVYCTLIVKCSELPNDFIPPNVVRHAKRNDSIIINIKRTDRIYAF
jgi:hypothetical protein